MTNGGSVSTTWKMPPDVKIYEALGSVADGRVQVDGPKGKVFSSSRRKYYDVIFDRDTMAIMSNDNGSYWQGYLGYPSIAYLLASSNIDFDRDVAEALKGFEWKKINQANGNNWDKTTEMVRSQLRLRDPNFDLATLDAEIKSVRLQLKGLVLRKLGPRSKPPAGD